MDDMQKLFKELNVQLQELRRRLDIMTLLLGNEFHNRQSDNPLALIATKVSIVTRVPVSEIRGPRQMSEIVNARWLAMYISRELTEYSLQRIGNYYGRDHSSVAFAVRGVNAWIEVEDERGHQARILVNELRPALATLSGGPLDALS